MKTNIRNLFITMSCLILAAGCDNVENALVADYDNGNKEEKTMYVITQDDKERSGICFIGNRWHSFRNG